MADSTPEQTLTRLPIEIEAEDPFIQLGEWNFSLRQALTVAMTGLVWFLLFKVSSLVLPLSPVFIGIAWSWVLVGGIVLALVPRDGVSMEEYLTRKLTFLLSHRHYILKESDDVQKAVQKATEADWDDLEDDEYELPRF